MIIDRNTKHHIWFYFSTYSSAVFVLFNCLVVYSSNLYNHCNYSIDTTLGYQLTNDIVLGGFVVLFLMLSLRLYLFHKQYNLSLYVTHYIISLGLITSFLIDYNKTYCVDKLGVATSPFIWAEWVACSPLIIYSTIIITEEQLTWKDFYMMATFKLSIIFGFLIIVANSFESAVLFLIISILLTLPMNALLFYNADEIILTYDSEVSQEVQTELRIELGTIRKELSWFLCLIFPIYSVVYICAIFGAMNHETTLICFNLLSFITKGIYVEQASNKFMVLGSKVQEILHQEYFHIEARRSFIKYIFHSVRTPFNTIAIGLELLKESELLTRQHQQYLRMMIESCNNVSEVLDSVLTIQKIEEGKFELFYENCDIRKIVKTAFIVMEGAMIRKKIHHSVIFAENTPSSIYVDGKRLETVIINLLSNAVKFSPTNGTIVVNITFEYKSEDRIKPKKRFCGNLLQTIIPVNRADENDDVMFMFFSITDSGPGIAKEDKRKLFQVFTQSDANHVNDGHGFGLGLSFCKTIIKLHGGNIYVTSVEGKGTTFKFSVPIKQFEYSSTHDDEESSHEENAVITKDASGTPLGKASRRTTSAPNKNGHIVPEYSSVVPQVDFARDSSFKSKYSKQSTNFKSKTSVAEALIVDDSPMNRKMLKNLLRVLQIEADEAENGEEALKCVHKRSIPYKMIFMDGSMPIMDGVTCIKHLRARKYNSIITGLTGNVIESDIQDFMKSGANFVFKKPMSKDKLKKLLHFIHTHEHEQMCIGTSVMIETEDSFRISTPLFH